jgi:multicomponent Na+:H+ antiporter subunit D
MTGLIVTVVAAPLVGAALSVTAARRLAWQRAIGLVTVAVVAAASVALLASVDAGGTAVVEIGSWPAPVGIVLVADRLSAVLLAVSAVMLLAVLVYAIAQVEAEADAWFFHPVYLTLTAGTAIAFLTGDVFNLFVGFEITLVSSYVLLSLRAGKHEVRAGMTYVVINLLASALFLTGVAFLYASTGTVNMADLSGRVADLPPAVTAGLATLFLVVFGIKAAIFPLFSWLPDSYPAAPTPVAAIFAGLLTKIGVYAIVRSQTIVFPQDGPSSLVLFLAGATMLVGVLGAIAQSDIKRLLSFHIVSQIGYMVMGLGFLTVAGVAATIVFMVHQIVVKAGLFLVGGLVEVEAGTGRLERLGGMLHRRPGVAVLFLVLALSLAGIPPLSGFVGKLALVQAGLAADRNLVVAVSLVVSLFTLFSMLKIWAGAFWGDEGKVDPRPIPRGMLASTAAVAGFSLVVALAAGPLWDLATMAAEDLVDPSSYVMAVLGDA